LLEELQEETRTLMGRRSVMQIAPEEGTLLALLVASIGARNVVEIGTFTGYSALCMARALPPGGKLVACDVSEEYTAVARRFWQKAGVADRIGGAFRRPRRHPTGAAGPCNRGFASR